jgi:hypothetical protein
MGNKFVSPIGKLAWSAITEQTLNLKQEPEWNCGLVLPEEQSNSIVENIEECLRLYRIANATFPRENTGLNFPFGQSMKKNEAGVKVPEPGVLMFKFKRPGAIFRKATGQKEANSGPLVFDSKGRPVTGLPKIGPGSLVKIVYDTYGYDKAGQKGVGLQLLGVQIVKLELDIIELEEVEGGWVADAAPAEPPSALAAMLNGGGDGAYDDDVPY